MRHSSSTLEALPRLTSKERASLDGAHPCGCFHCQRMFAVREIKDWTPMLVDGESDALCPHCGVDSVLAAREGRPVDREMLKALHAYWFERTMQLPDKPGTMVDTMKQRLQPLLRRLSWDLWGSKKDAD